MLRKNKQVITGLLTFSIMCTSMSMPNAYGSVRVSENVTGTVTEFTEETVTNLDTLPDYNSDSLGVAGENLGNIDLILPSAKESDFDVADNPELDSPQNVNFETGESPVMVAQDTDYVTKNWGIKFEATDFDLLCRLVEAEAGNQGYKGQVLVADIILNRVLDSHFPDTIQGVIYANSNGVYQFSCIPDGRFDSVTVSNSTKLAVADAMAGVDYSQGTLYFCTPEVSDKWHDHALKFAFRYKGHNFYWRNDE